MIFQIAGFVAMALAGVGGCLLGVRAADWVNAKLGRTGGHKPEKQ